MEASCIKITWEMVSNIFLLSNVLEFSCLNESPIQWGNFSFRLEIGWEAYRESINNIEELKELNKNITSIKLKNDF